MDSALQLRSDTVTLCFSNLCLALLRGPDGKGVPTIAHTIALTIQQDGAVVAQAGRFQQIDGSGRAGCFFQISRSFLQSLWTFEVTGEHKITIFRWENLLAPRYSGP